MLQLDCRELPSDSSFGHVGRDTHRRLDAHVRRYEQFLDLLDHVVIQGAPGHGFRRDAARRSVDGIGAFRTFLVFCVGHGRCLYGGVRSFRWWRFWRDGVRSPVDAAAIIDDRIEAFVKFRGRPEEPFLQFCEKRHAHDLIPEGPRWKLDRDGGQDRVLRSVLARLVPDFLEAPVVPTTLIRPSWNSISSDRACRASSDLVSTDVPLRMIA